jgi:hypothetical protein
LLAVSGQAALQTELQAGYGKSYRSDHPEGGKSEGFVNKS